MTKSYSGKDIYGCCFVKHPTEPNKHVCSCCKHAINADVVKHGYQNCKIHLKLNHEHMNTTGKVERFQYLQTIIMPATRKNINPNSMSMLLF